MSANRDQPADKEFTDSLGFRGGRYRHGKFGSLMFNQYARDGVLRMYVIGVTRIDATKLSRGEVLDLLQGLGLNGVEDSACQTT